jgi:hypothetical protein
MGLAPAALVTARKYAIRWLEPDAMVLLLSYIGVLVAIQVTSNT